MKSFTYLWIDFGDGPAKFYIGRKIGDFWQIDSSNNYQCTSKLVLAEMEKRPQDFKRFLIDTFSDKVGHREQEAELLQSVDAARNPLYYNQHNENGKFIVTSEKMTVEWRQNISKASKGKPKRDVSKWFGNRNKRGKTQIAWNKGVPRTWVGPNHLGRKRSEETKRKISLSKIGKPRPWTPEWRERATNARIGKKRGPYKKRASV